MEVPRPPPRFVAPDQRPSSPPATPGTRSRNTSATSYSSFSRNKRNGFIHLGISPPENIEPKGLGHAFSYHPPHRDDDESSNSSSSSTTTTTSAEADDDEDSDENDPIPEIETRSDVSKLRASIIFQLDDFSDFEAEEISDDDISYDDESIHIQPDETEEAESDEEAAPEPPPEQEDILESLKNLKCGGQQEREKAQEFEEAQRQRYKKKKNRWSVGGTKKRSHTQSIGSKSSDNDDIDLLDDVETGSRRLRRRTYGREEAERPNRSSLLFEIPPAEIEEIGYSETIQETIPVLEAEISSSDLDSDDDLSLSEDDDDDDDADTEDSDSDDEDDGELIADEDMLVPAWLMEIDSNPPSPASTVEL